jgi:hypothetical protein
VTGASGGTGKETYTLANDAAPGAVITGISGDTNTLDTSGTVNLSTDSISDIQTLAIASGGSAVNLTSAQFNAFTSMTGGGSGTQIYVTNGGTDSLANVTAQVSSFLATGWDGTTLTGNNQNGQQLGASLFGNDTLKAGNGTGDQLVAGEGVDTLIGGTGGDSFIAYNGLAAGSVLTGNGSGNILYGGGDFSQGTLSGIQTLEASTESDTGITLNASQFCGFSTFSLDATGITASTGGTYNLTGKKVIDGIGIDATSAADTTLIGDGDFIASGDGDDTLIAANDNRLSHTYWKRAA